MKKMSLITVLDVTGYDGEDVLTSEEPLFMQLVEGYPSMDDVFEFEEVIDIVEHKNKGAEIQVIVDYLEYVHGDDNSNESLRDKEKLLDKLFDDLTYYLDNDSLILVESDECIITVEEPNGTGNEIVETDMLS